MVDTFLIISFGIPSEAIRLSIVRGVAVASIAPDRCPACDERNGWSSVDQSNKGFSVGKVAVGAVLLGPLLV